MGVYIRDMEMPSRRESCPFCSVVANDEPLCDLLVGELCLFGVACPLILVQPHGRLIDADALMKILSKVIDINASIEQRNEATDQERRCLWWFEQQIGIAPTIIPAEEGE